MKDKSYKSNSTPDAAQISVNLPDRTLRCRHEIKYHISESEAEAIT